ncbi:MAG: DHA2 family efflux MFS transporter permease subunit [Gemmatimonadota bacterium]
MPLSRKAERYTLLASILGSSMSFIDGTVVNVALPALQRAFNANAADMQWVVQSYALTLATLLLLGGALGDRFGRRLIFSIGVTLFSVASLACGLATGIAWLTIARGVQGIGGALLVPGSLALIGATIPDERRGRAIGIWSGASAAAAGAGPIFGGWLIGAASWRWIFWINLPLAAATLLITWRGVPESRDPHAPKHLDLAGASLATLGLGALIYGLTESSTRGLAHLSVWGSILVGVLCLTAFVVVEAREKAPMVPLALFRIRTFAGANLLTLLLYGALGGAFFFIPFNLIQVHHYSATAAGAAMGPIIVAMFVLSGPAGKLADRFGARILLVIGPTLAGAGFALLALPGTTGGYWTTFFPGMAVLGLGMGISVAPLTTAVMGSAGTEHSGTASGINNAISRTAGLVALAIFGVIAVWRFGRSLDSGLSDAGVPARVHAEVLAEKGKLAGAEVPKTVSPALQGRVRDVIDSSFVDAFRLVMLISGGLAVGGAASAGILIKTKAGGRARA